MGEFPNLGLKEEAHLSAFIRAFVRKEKQHRWRAILSMKTTKWAGVSAHDVAPPELGANWNTPRCDVLEALNLGKEVDREALVFAIGHSTGGVSHGT
jgi:hypothetical protein